MRRPAARVFALLAILPIVSIPAIAAGVEAAPPRARPAAAAPALAAGPMLGFTGARNATLWAQTRTAARVAIRHRKESGSDWRTTEAVRSSAAEDFAVTLRVEDLAPATAYRYEVLVDGRPVPTARPLRFSTAPLWDSLEKAPDVTVAFGSCFYVDDPEIPGDRNGGGFEILDSIARLAPDLMLWIGDNVYLRDGDFDSAGAMARRWRLTRGDARLQPLLAATRHLATWDDHDYGENDGDASASLKEEALALHARYFPPARRYGAPGVPGVFQRFRWADAEFFLLDDRWFRSPRRWPDGPDKAYLGKEQLRWLKESLRSAPAAHLKVIVTGSQALNANTPFESWSHYADELKDLLDFLRRARVERVVFLSGDRHWSELLRREEPGLYPLYDFTASPLTSEVRPHEDGDPEVKNPLRVPGALAWERSFGVLRLTGPPKARRVAFEGHAADGTLRFRHEIGLDDLTIPAP